MVKITVSESNSKNLNVAYIYNSMTRYLSICGADADITFDDSRTNLVMTAENRFHSYLRKFTEERVAESVAIGYKYAPSGSKISASIPSTVFLISVCRRSKKNGRASSTASRAALPSAI